MSGKAKGVNGRNVHMARAALRSSAEVINKSTKGNRHQTAFEKTA